MTSELSNVLGDKVYVKTVTSVVKAKMKGLGEC